MIKIKRKRDKILNKTMHITVNECTRIQTNTRVFYLNAAFFFYVKHVCLALVKEGACKNI